MTPFHAHVRNGRLTMDEPTDLPEGTVLELVPADPGDDLDDADRSALHAALLASIDEERQGHLFEADQVIRELKVTP